MSLINCPECGKSVSDSAHSCPNCGLPIAGAREAHAAGAPLTTVQETSKKLKLHTIIAVTAVSIGVVWLIAQGEQKTPAPVFVILGGLVWYFATRFRIWWHHK